MKKLLNNNLINGNTFNVLVLFFVMVISVSIGLSADMPTSIGFGGFIPLLTPPISMICTLIGFYIFKYAFKKPGWIITIIGIFYMLYKAIDWYIYWKNY